MKLPALLEGRLIRRYKRFLADIELCPGISPDRRALACSLNPQGILLSRKYTRLFHSFAKSPVNPKPCANISPPDEIPGLADGTIVTAHTPNTGSMAGLTRPGSRVWLRDSGNPKRKYPLSWILVEAHPGVLVGIDTGMANQLVREAIETGVITSLQGYQHIRNEVRYGNERSRIDLLLESDDRPRCYVEVKNVTLVENGTAYFPDAVTERGRKHLRELAGRVAAGERGVIVYCVQRQDAKALRPADHIDPAYGKALRKAVAQGVEAYAWRATVTVKDIRLDTQLPVAL